jgi:bifunctional DNA-binding transcriptional regulator/antitoxin component of YhaV-PrlF toxin-antitoxin module
MILPGGVMSGTEVRTYQLKVDSAGRVVLPADFRLRSAIATGDQLVADDDGAGIRIRTVDQAIAEAQALVARLVPEGVSLVDELIAEREEEAARE